MSAHPIQLELRPRTWGGRRPGAGRKASGRKVGVAHRPRPAHVARHPLHVTLRAGHALPSLRSDRLFVPLRRGLARASRGGFRIPVLGPEQSRPYDRGGRGSPRAFTRVAGAEHPARKISQPGTRPPGGRVGRAIPRAAASDTARGSKRSRLRSAELEKTLAGRSRARSAFLRDVV